MHLGCTLDAAIPEGDGICLRISQHDGHNTTLQVNHLIAATGFRVDIQRLPFLHRDLLNQIRLIEGAPRLSRFFESSVPGLYFTGVSAANSFGPLLRFVLGTGFAAPRLGAHLAGKTTG
jgi:hypothetical protein